VYLAPATINYQWRKKEQLLGFVFMFQIITIKSNHFSWEVTERYLVSPGGENQIGVNRQQ
jgi:hypothetical protein